MSLVFSAGVSSLVLALGMTPTFGAFTASISGDVNSAGTGTIVMQETDSSGTITCLSTDGGGVWLNAASCSAMNKYGGDLGMPPGDSAVVVTYIRQWADRHRLRHRARTHRELDEPGLPTRPTTGVAELHR